MNELGYFEARGTNVLVYNNLYNGGFYDEKFAGMEIIQRGERLATGGGIRLMNTPEQWDIFGTVSDRIVDREGNFVQVTLTHTDYDFAAKFRVTPKDGGCLVQVILDKPVPEKLVGKAGLNLEFFPASYFGKNYLVDGMARILPKYPMHDTEVHPVSEKITQYFGESTFDDRGRGDFLVAKPMSVGHQIVLAPEDEALRVGVKSDTESRTGCSSCARSCPAARPARSWSGSWSPACPTAGSARRTSVSRRWAIPPRRRRWPWPSSTAMTSRPPRPAS